jgi:hypothetical protein
MVNDMLRGRSWTWTSVIGEGLKFGGVVLLIIAGKAVLRLFVEWKDFYSTWKANRIEWKDFYSTWWEANH